MKFIPKLPDDTVNISHSKPLLEFLKLFSVLIAIIIAFYLLTGLLTFLIVPHLPHSVEKSMGAIFTDQYCKNELPEKSRKMQKLLDELVPFIENSSLPFTVCVVDSDIVNALAVPGGTIVVYKGLSDKFDDDALRFVLAHELGHFHNRDHLKSMGRTLPAVLISMFLTENESAVMKILTETISLAEKGFSRSQETAADIFSLDLIFEIYGYEKAEKSLRFMEEIKKEEASKFIPEYFSTHPTPSKRLSVLKKHLESY